MLRYIVKASFWSPAGKVNWDSEEYGREGVGIPKKLVLKARNLGVDLRIKIESSEAIYEINPAKILEHDKVWNTRKTAPKNTQNLFIIIPVGLMDFKSYTAEKQEKIDLANREAEERKKIAEMQVKLF